MSSCHVPQEGTVVSQFTPHFGKHPLLSHSEHKWRESHFLDGCLGQLLDLLRSICKMGTTSEIENCHGY